MGNWLTSLGVASYAYNNANELTSTSNATYTYDNNGNIISKADSTGTTTYAWDFENRLTSVTLPGSGGTINFKYDPIGHRIYKSSPSGATVFVYDINNLIETTSAAGSPLERYTQGLATDEPLMILQGTTTAYYEADGLDSITSLTNPNGSIAATYTYNSFGNNTNSSGSLANPFRYTGREFDSETNMYFYRAGYYDSSTGRFISEDPARFRASTNFFAYAENDPADRTDPLGLTSTLAPTFRRPFGFGGSFGPSCNLLAPTPDRCVLDCYAWAAAESAACVALALFIGSEVLPECFAHVAGELGVCMTLCNLGRGKRSD